MVSLIERVKSRPAGLARYYRNSRIGRTIGRIATATRRSWSVRWLTAEPDPEVIVIDLRETRTVGPVVRVLDWLLPSVERSVRASKARSLVQRALEEVRAAPVQIASVFVLVAVFAWFARAWPEVTPPTFLIAGVVGVSALFGLRVTHTWDELAEGRVGRLLAASLAPSDPPNREEP